MNALIDDFIHDDIANMLATKKISWMMPVVEIEENSINPFLAPDIIKEEVNQSQIYSTSAGRLFLDRCCEMKLLIEEPQTENKSNENELINKKQKNCQNFLSNLYLMANKSTDKSTSSIISTNVNNINNNTNNNDENINNNVNSNSVNRISPIVPQSILNNSTNNKNDNIKPIVGNDQMNHKNNNMSNNFLFLKGKGTGSSFYVTLKVTKIQSPLSFIEPILCTCFLYSKKTNRIVSDLWNFVPTNSQMFFENADIPFASSDFASFEVNPKSVVKRLDSSSSQSLSSLLIVVILSHPTTVDNGALVLKHYMNPSTTNSNSAIKVAKPAFSKNPKAFSTFAFTYAPFSFNSEEHNKKDNTNKEGTSNDDSNNSSKTSSSINNSVNSGEGVINENEENEIILTFPNVFLTDHPLFETEINDMISEAANKHLKQIPFSISMNVVENFVCKNIIRPIHKPPLNPYMMPIHQLSVRLVGLKLAGLTTSQRNVSVRMSLIIDNAKEKKTLKMIHSKLNPAELVEYEFSRIWYHEKSPKFDDIFIVELPYPIQGTPYSLYFEIFHIHAKSNETKTMTLIGTSSLPLFQNIKNQNNASAEADSILIADDLHVLSVSCDKSSKFTIETCLRSNLATNDAKYYEFQKLVAKNDKGAIKSDLIKAISPSTLAANLLVILDSIFSLYSGFPNISLKPFLTIIETLKPVFKPKKTTSFFLLYAKYFAFNSFSQTKFINSTRITKSVKLIVQPQILQERDVFIDLDDPRSPLKKRSQSNPGAPIDFDNDTLFEADSKDLQQKQTPIEQQQSSQLQYSQTNSNLNLNPITNSSPIPKQSTNANTDTDTDTNVTDKLIQNSDFEGIIKNKKRSTALGTAPSPIYNKITQSTNIYLKKTKTNALDELLPIIDFVTLLLIKSLLLAKNKELSQDFEEFVDLLSQHASKSKNIDRIAWSFGAFTYMLFDVGLATAAAVANSAFIRWTSIETILKYISSAYHPDLFLYSVRYIEIFREQFFDLVKISFVGDNCRKMQPFFQTINKVCQLYDDENKVIIASKLLNCTYNIRPTQIPIGTDISDSILFLNFLLTFCDKDSITKTIINGKVPEIMSLMNYLLDHSFDTKPFQTLNNNSNNSTINPSHKRYMSKNQDCNDVKLPMKPNLYATVKVRRIERLELKPPSQNNNKMNNNGSNQKDAALVDNLDHRALFRFAELFAQVTDFQGCTFLIGFLYHAMKLEISLEYSLKAYDLLCFLLKKFSPDVLEIRRPCFVKIVNTMFRTSLLSPQFHHKMAEIIFTMFQSDISHNKTNNRSLVICIRALSLMHYSQLTLGKFQKFMNLFSKQKENPCLTTFFKIFEKLRKISQFLEIPKLTTTQRAEYLFQRFSVFKHSPDAQITALEELKKHQIENGNILEALNITILISSIVFENLVRIGKIPNYYSAKFSRKPGESFVSFLGNNANSTYSGIFSSSSKNSVGNSLNMDRYYIGSTTYCNAEILKDLPMIPGFCDSDIFSELGFISLLFSIFELSEKKADVYGYFLNSILDFVWPIYESRRFYGQISKVFDMYEKIFNKTSNNYCCFFCQVKYFHVTLIGKIFDDDNKKSYIYRTDSFSTLKEFSDHLLQTYKLLFGEKKVELLNKPNDPINFVEDFSTLDNSNVGLIQVNEVEPYIVGTERNFLYSDFFSDKYFSSINEGKNNEKENPKENQKGNKKERKNQNENENENVIENNKEVEKESKNKRKSKSKNKCNNNKDKAKIEKLENQRIERRIFHTTCLIPSLIEREKIISSETIYLSPIEVVYKRVVNYEKALKHAISLKNIEMIQRILTDILLVSTPNEKKQSILRIVDIFYSNKDSTTNGVDDKKEKENNSDAEEKEKNDDNNNVDDDFDENVNLKEKGKDKTKENELALIHNNLKILFLELIDDTKKGIKIHSEWITSNLDYVPLQVRFEDSLNTFIQNNEVIFENWQK